MAAESKRVFFDTNVLVYQFDHNAPAKRDRAIELIQKALAGSSGLISSQVVQEFMNVALRKFSNNLLPADIQPVMEGLLEPMCAHFPTIQFYERALRLFAVDTVSFYDALIIQAAVDLDCATLFSEDLQDGRRFGGLVVKNPF